MGRFRAIVFRDGDEVYTQSRDLKPLDRYFPELAEPLRAALPERAVVDGKWSSPATGRSTSTRCSFASILPASRVNMLAAESPASFVAWDLLALGDDDLRDIPQGERRARLESALAGIQPPVHLTPATTDRGTAGDWFQRFEGAGLDGVVAKRIDAGYQPGKRAMLKIKHQRTADCVVAGFRWHKNGPGTHIGSLLLGLYDESGKLNHVGITSSFSWDRRAALAEEHLCVRTRSRATRGRNGPNGRAGATPRRPGSCPVRHRAGTAARTCPGSRCVPSGSSRSPTTTCRATGSAATTFKRWRPDKPPEACRYDQLETTAPFELEAIFGT